MDRIAILAGSYRQYQDFMRQPERGEPCEYVYVDYPRKARENRFVDYKIVGTFWERPDAGDLEREVKSRIIQPSLIIKEKSMTTYHCPKCHTDYYVLGDLQLPVPHQCASSSIPAEYCGRCMSAPNQ